MSCVGLDSSVTTRERAGDIPDNNTHLHRQPNFEILHFQKKQMIKISDLHRKAFPLTSILTILISPHHHNKFQMLTRSDFIDFKKRKSCFLSSLWSLVRSEYVRHSLIVLSVRTYSASNKFWEFVPINSSHNLLSKSRFLRLDMFRRICLACV